MFETLERRQLLSAALENGVLSVFGTALGDEITIIRPKVAPDFLRLSFNGRFRRFPIADVHRIEVYGRRGNDVISVGFANYDPAKIQVYIAGTGGSDTIAGSLGNDTLIGDSGDDSIIGLDGNDSLVGGQGNDSLIGQAGKDTMVGGDGDDFMDGIVGTDSVDGGNGMDRAGELAAPGAARKMVYSQKYNLLFLLNSGSAVRVVDLRTGIAISTRLASNEFTDIDLSPSGDYLFAADFGGEDIGYGSPSTPSRIQRYNLRTRSWEGPKDASGVVYRIEAVDDQRVVTLSSDQWTTIQLLRFDATQVTRLANISGDYSGDIEYDPRTGRIFQGNSGISSSEVHVYRVVGNTLTSAEATPTYGPLGEYGYGLTTLATDGSVVYYGEAQLESLDVTNIMRTFSEDIVAASGDLAISQSKVFDAATGNLKLNLGITDAVIGLSPTSDTFYAYSPAADKLYLFT
jgi:Ca2+-binding RTX toxin-like protein